MSSEEREATKDSLRMQFENMLDDRVNRRASVNHLKVIGAHHFSYASTECIDLYQDGYFLSCTMVTQAIADGIVRFVAERNSITPQDNETKQALVQRMHQLNIVSTAFLDAFARIQRSFRNDYHHMNPPVDGLDHALLAKRNIDDLALIEREIFESTFGDGGTLIPKNAAYWDVADDGTVPVYVRFG